MNKTMNNSKLKITHCWLGIILLVAVFFLSYCNRTRNMQTGNSFSTDSLFVNKLTERQLGKSRYRISIPADYSIKILEGEDFEVYYIQPTDTAAQALFTAGVYFGNFPNEFKPNNDSCKTENHKSKILGKNAEWTLYNCNGEYSIQTTIDSKSGESWNKYIHAFGNASSITELPKLFDIFKTMRKDNE